MLKKRLIACVLVRDGIVVQSIGFKKYLPVGRAEIAVEFLNQWGIDEIVLMDISASKHNRCIDSKLVERVSRFCQVPLAVAGGIQQLSDVQPLMDSGADKVVINQANFHNPELISSISDSYGVQCVVAAVDVKQIDSKSKNADAYRVYDYRQSHVKDIHPTVWAERLEDLGAGEIFLHSVDNDGQYCGYAMPIIKAVADSVSIPVIASGGAGHAGHMAEAFEHTKVPAVAAANFFHFTEHSVNRTKAALCRDFPIRCDNPASYLEHTLDESFRLCKRPDALLERQRFKRIEREII